MPHDDVYEILNTLVCKYRASKKNTEGISGKKTRMIPKKDAVKTPESYASFSDAADMLGSLGFVAVIRPRYTDSITEIVLNDERIEDAEAYLKENYGICPWPERRDKCLSLINDFSSCNTPAAASRVRDLKESIQKGHVPKEHDINRERDMIRSLAAIEENREKIYVRELSVRLFGDSKTFENSVMDSVCSYLRKVYKKPCFSLDGLKDQNDEILCDFHIFRPGQKIFLKGGFDLEFKDGSFVHGEDFPGVEMGISLSDADFESLCRISIPGRKFITIENKTVFAAAVPPKDTVLFYLAGFCAKSLREFLRETYRQNPDTQYLHFGDIDAGGFKILKNLREITGIPFKPYRMGISELKKYEPKGKALTGRDREALKTFLPDPEFGETAAYMLEHDIKLEQEVLL